MFTYLEMYVSNNNIDYPFLEVNMFQKGQVWKTTSNKTIVSNHPPLEEITIIAQNTEIIVSPFKTLNPKDIEGRTVTLKDCKNLQQQTNFTNQILGTLSSQLDRIEDKLETPHLSRPIVIPHFLDRNLDKNRLIFKPVKVGNKTLKLSNNDDLIQTNKENWTVRPYKQTLNFKICKHDNRNHTCKCRPNKSYIWGTKPSNK